MATKYKMKTKSSVKKRFKLTSKGKIKRKKANLRHCLGSKTTGQKRNLRKTAYIAECQEHQIKVMAPYGLA